jgi:hypothetical protein
VRGTFGKIFNGKDTKRGNIGGGVDDRVSGVV